MKTLFILTLLSATAGATECYDRCTRVKENRMLKVQFDYENGLMAEAYLNPWKIQILKNYSDCTQVCTDAEENNEEPVRYIFIEVPVSR